MSIRRRIALVALIIALGNIASRLLGLVREQTMAWLFGATGATDTFVAASTVPQMVYDLLVGGAISAALVPVFVEATADEERLWRLVSSVLNIAVVLLVMVAVALAILAEPLVGVLVAGFEPWQHAQAVGMIRAMLIAVVLQGLSGVMMAVLYAQSRVGLPAFAPAVYNGGVILLAILLHETLGVQALVVGVLAGAAGQLLLQLGGLRRIDYRPVLGLRSPEVRTIARLYAPVAAGMVVTIAGTTIDRNLASTLEAGSMTVMAYATRLIQFPLGLVATATAFAVLPMLAKHASGPSGPTSEQEREAYRSTLVFGIKIVLLLMVPATVGLVALREPLVRLLFEHRAFTEYDTLRTATVFLFYAPQLPLTALDQLLIFAFYARRDTMTPVIVGVGTVICYLVVALATKDWLGVYGLALANAVQNSMHGLVLLWLIWRAVGGLGGTDLLGFTSRVLAAAGIMAVVLAAGLSILEPQADRSVAGVAGVLVGGVVLGGISYAASILALRLPEMHQLVELAAVRFRRSSIPADG